MIDASDYLKRITLSADDSEKFSKTFKEIEVAAENERSLAGFFVKVHPERLFCDGSPNIQVCRAIQIALQKKGWTCEITLHPSELNPRLPGFWKISVMPTETTLNAASVQLADKLLH